MASADPELEVELTRLQRELGDLEAAVGKRQAADAAELASLSAEKAEAPARLEAAHAAVRQMDAELEAARAAINGVYRNPLSLGVRQSATGHSMLVITLQLASVFYWPVFIDRRALLPGAAIQLGLVAMGWAIGRALPRVLVPR